MPSRSGRLAHVQDLVDDQVAGDPVTRAFMAPVKAAVHEALTAHTPRLAYKTAEACEILQCSPSTITALVNDGRLRRIAGPQSSITWESILEVAGWPVQPANLVAPLEAIPTPRQAS